jgi:putative DNA primase/helicase
VWCKFLKVVLADVELRAFVRRLVGYCLTGSTQEHVLPFLYGIGSNGKSTFLNVVLALLGVDYAIKAPTDLLLAKKNETHPTELADLFGKRFVACIEAEDGRRLAESLVKELTGGDRIRARHMREDFWEFSATHKIWLAANHKPQVRGTDHGIWRRIKLIPFTVIIPDDQQDKELLNKLLAELPGILNWALAGCLEWQQAGLGEPPAVKAATADYRNEMDVLGDFIADRCIIGDDYGAGSAQLFEAYKAWAESAGERPVTQRRFGLQMVERGFRSDRYTAGPHKGRNYWRGIGIIQQ